MSVEWENNPKHSSQNFYITNYTGDPAAFVTNITPTLSTTPNTRETTRKLYEFVVQHGCTASHPCLPHNFHCAIQDFPLSQQFQGAINCTPSGFDMANIQRKWINLGLDAEGRITSNSKPSDKVAEQFAVVYNGTGETIFIQLFEVAIGYSNALEQDTDAKNDLSFDAGPEMAAKVELKEDEQWNIKVSTVFYTVRFIETTAESHLDSPATVITQVPSVDDFVQGTSICKVQCGNILVLLWDKTACRARFYLYTWDSVKRVNGNMVTNINRNRK